MDAADAASPTLDVGVPDELEASDSEMPPGIDEPLLDEELPPSDADAWDEADVPMSPPTLVTFIIQPRNDATVAAAKPNAAYGAMPYLCARGAPVEQRAYFEFVVAGVGTEVQQATLRLYCVDSSLDAGSVYVVAAADDGAPPTWEQDELSWNNAPRLQPAPLARLGQVVAGSWVEVDVSGAVVGDGTYGFALASAAGDLVAFAAREGPAPPELEITAALRVEDGNTLPVAADDAIVLENTGTFESYAPGLLENDTDSDGDPLVLVSSTQPAHGACVATNDGGFTYRPEPGYDGPDSFTYSVSDGRGGTSTATVAITVQPGSTDAESWPEAWTPESEPEVETRAPSTRIVPNPSRGSTSVEFQLQRDCHVEAAIYDARGHRVRLLAAGSHPAGLRQLPWNGTDDRGDALPAGIYFLRLQLGDTVQRHKIVLQR